MSVSDADAFLQRLEEDETFAVQLNEVSDDPEATRARAQQDGFTFTSEEMVEALAERYGIELSIGDLEAIAAGTDAQQVVGHAVEASTAAGAFLVSVAAVAAI